MEILLFSLGIGMIIFIVINLRTMIIYMLKGGHIVSKGLVWFSSLLFINVFLIVFTIIWKNYTKRKLERGKEGPIGYQGRKGQEGNTEIKCIELNVLN